MALTNITTASGEILDKAQIKRARSKASLHEALLVNEGYTIAEARLIAWIEGEQGLADRTKKGPML